MPISVLQSDNKGAYVLFNFSISVSVCFFSIRDLFFWIIISDLLICFLVFVFDLVSCFSEALTRFQYFGGGQEGAKFLKQTEH